MQKCYHRVCTFPQNATSHSKNTGIIKTIHYALTNAFKMQQ